MRRIVLAILKVAVSAALLYVALAKVDFVALSSRFGPASFMWIAAALVLLLIQVMLAGFRWHLLSESCGAPLSAVTATRFVLIGNFFNQTLPSSIGGDAVRVWLVGRRAGWRGATYSVFIDRAIGLMGLAVVILLCLPWSLSQFHDGRARAGLLLAEGAALAGTIGFLFVGLLPQGLLDRWKPTHHIRNCSIVAWKALTDRRSGVAVCILSVVIHAMNACVTWFAANAIGADVSMFQLLLLVPPVTLVMLLPISIAGWGLRETALGAGFAAIGLVAADGVAVSLVYGATSFLIGGLGGLAWVLSAEKAEQGTKPIEIPDELEAQ